MRSAKKKKKDSSLSKNLTLVGVLVEMLDSASVEGGGTTNDTMDLVTLLDQKLGKVRSILTSDT